MRIQHLDNLIDLRETGYRLLFPEKPLIGVGLGTCGIGNGADKVYAALGEAIAAAGIDVSLRPVGCFGFCAAEPLVNISMPGMPMIILSQVQTADVPAIVDALKKGTLPTQKVLCKIETWDHITRSVTYANGLPEIPAWDTIPFFKGQTKMVLRNCGLINPENIDEYFGIGGYHGLYEALQKPSPETVIDQIKKSKLRGRGGAGYPTGAKWAMLRQAKSDIKYLICNADEGDPGAYMNRNEIEGDPHMLIEGMLIGAYATGATHGIIYLRAEYPLAVKRLRQAVEQARAYGLLGENIFGSQMSFDLQLVEGAGAFVCGEETAMIASLEGRAGRPRPRPPYPAEAGLWGKPTNINNVETWCNVPIILARGGTWFAATGTPNCPGTKVFSLVGKIRNTGLVEMPLGARLSDIIYEIGGGSTSGKPVKAVQTGGPSGGCIPAELFDTPVDYESLGKLGAIMGSGGMVVMDEDTCMVDVARYFIEFSHSESCGKCTPCRAGLDQALRILNRITSGHGRMEDLPALEELGQMIRESSLCGLGQTAPNPVLTTLRYFRREYERHILERRCVGGICDPLYVAPCENSCPLNMRIPTFLQLINEGRMEEAAEVIWLDNPLPASTGRVCQLPCEDRCRRANFDTPVNMREVHRSIADTLMNEDTVATVTQKLIANRLPATGKRVAIVGAGPAGLSAAYYLALLGHEVRVFESEAEAGGMLRYSLPEYRLPKAVLNREIQVIHELGVQFEFSKRIGTDFTIEKLRKDFDSVLLTLGTWKERDSGINEQSNRKANGVWPAIGLLKAVAKNEPADLGAQVVVIGGGNAAIDAARTALRLGAQASVVYRRSRSDMPAIPEEVVEAEAEGVTLRLHATPRRILRDAKGNITGIEVTLVKPGPYDTSGRRSAIPTDATEVLPCSAVVMAIGEIPDTASIEGHGIEIKDAGRIGADWRTFETSLPGVYVAGDVANGATNVTTAMGTAKRAAQSIDELLMGRDRLREVMGHFEIPMKFPYKPRKVARHTSVLLPIAERQGNSREVMLGIGAAEARAESSRCLRCDVKKECVHR